MLDDKGRLNIFGWRVNIIDFLVLVFIACLMPMFFIGYRIMTNAPQEAPVTITLDRARYEEEQKKYDKLSVFLKEHKRLKKYFE